MLSRTVTRTCCSANLSGRAPPAPGTRAVSEPKPVYLDFGNTAADPSLTDEVGPVGTPAPLGGWTWNPITADTTTVVAADGGDSPVRQRLGFRAREWSYGQTAVIANITPGRPHQGVAYERFTDTGPLALLPMTEGRCSLVWTQRDAEVEALLALDDQAFLRALQARFGQRLGRFARVGRRASYPLRQLLVSDSVRPRLALIGNAAHTLHPVAGQGFNLGLRDVAVLAELLVEQARAGGDPGAMPLLARYRDWRRPDQNALALVTDGLVRLFSNPLLPLRLGRNLGLLGFDLLPPLKQAGARRFMGLGGRLPRLARGLPLVAGGQKNV